MALPAINEIDFNESGEWPISGKVFAIILLCVFVWFLGYTFIIKDKEVALTMAESEELALKKTLNFKYGKAINLDTYKMQMKEMNTVFNAMLQQLPKKSEVAALLIDISSAGLINGLTFELFQPDEEVPKDFYAELPIEMTVTGNYHQFGAFVSAIATLPRIVTIHNFDVKPQKKGLEGLENMTMRLTAKTYRYFDLQ